MAAYTYDQVRRALRHLEFRLVRSRKHETWERVAPNGTILQVRLSHKGSRTIPPGTFGEILRQAGITRDQFRDLI